VKVIQFFRRRRAVVATTIGVLVVLTLMLNIQSLLWAVAVLSAEKRPALLADARWEQPTSARAFRSRFQSGTDESELLAWLATNKFSVDQHAGRAIRLVRSVPCNESIQIEWTSLPGNKIDSPIARIREAGCL
jgi:hypothetical protein